MKIADHLRSVRHTFAANRARAALTLLGIMIGAGSIVLLAGLLRGGEEALVRLSQRANDADLIQVRRDDPPANQMRKTRRPLSTRDADELAASPLLADRMITSESPREARILWPKKKRVRLVGEAPIALALYHLEIEVGRFLTMDDLHQRRRVCVVGQEVWQEVLESRPTLDNVELAIEGQMWSVVGVLKSKPLLGASDGTWMWNRKVIVPHTTFDAIFAPDHEAGRVFVRVGESGEGPLDERMRAVEGVVKGTLLRRHYGVQNFKIEGEEDTEKERLILTIIKMLLLGTGLLSLFVGGINIMNIMLVTVTERTREIGVRRAVGATPGAIMMQFLLEAAFIASTGGVIGVLGGVFLSWASATILTHVVGRWTLHVEPWSIVLGLALSVSTGLVFGLFPAWRAARLDPVEALRYE